MKADGGNPVSFLCEQTLALSGIGRIGVISVYKCVVCGGVFLINGSGSYQLIRASPPSPLLAQLRESSSHSLSLFIKISKIPLNKILAWYSALPIHANPYYYRAFFSFLCSSGKKNDFESECVSFSVQPAATGEGRSWSEVLTWAWAAATQGLRRENWQI